MARVACAQLLAFLFACSGALLLTVGTITALEERRVPFLAFALPPKGEAAATTAGTMMLLTALAAWTAAYLSPNNSILLATSAEMALDPPTSG